MKIAIAFVLCVAVAASAAPYGPVAVVPAAIVHHPVVPVVPVGVVHHPVAVVHSSSTVVQSHPSPPAVVPVVHPVPVVHHPALVAVHY